MKSVILLQSSSKERIVFLSHILALLLLEKIIYTFGNFIAATFGDGYYYV